MIAKRSDLPPWTYAEVETFPCVGLNIGTLLAALNKAAEADEKQKLRDEKQYQDRISNFISTGAPNG